MRLDWIHFESYIVNCLFDSIDERATKSTQFITVENGFDLTIGSLPEP